MRKVNGKQNDELLANIIENIHEIILELSDVSLQRKLWLNEHNDTGRISSYVELMCSLFDDNEFDVFVDKISFETGYSKDTVLGLKELRHLLNNYSQKDSDEEIINDIEWKKIVERAQKVIEKWDKT